MAAHDCRVREARFGARTKANATRGRVAHGQGTAKGADTYVGHFVRGRPDGKGIYTWENGARLEGSFKNGKANGPGVFVSSKGVRYEGTFENGKLVAKAEDCPATQGPLNC